MLKVRDARRRQRDTEICTHVLAAREARAWPEDDLSHCIRTNDEIQSGLSDDAFMSAEATAHGHPRPKVSERVGKSGAELEARVDVIQPAQIRVVVASLGTVTLIGNLQTKGPWW